MARSPLTMAGGEEAGKWRALMPLLRNGGVEEEVAGLTREKPAAGELVFCMSAVLMPCCCASQGCPEVPLSAFACRRPLERSEQQLVRKAQ
mmetsp:Transcript_23094/g.33549  ORF Transcript_23094/g.33549 Transcript_23094/m.33549 type:complete len:91 (+) Transcript_23094:271-543(+)